MKFNFRQIRASFSKELLVVLVLGFVAVGALVAWNQSQVRQIESRFIENQVQTVLDHKRTAIEHAMGAVYDDARTISLLPSVRRIQGGNRKDDAQDVVQEGRFTEEGHQTVQQIYNNLATRVHVSEVYAVIEGLNSAAGEIPFFMYDAPVMDNAETAEEKDETPNADRPEESEQAEYAYFPKQIAAIRAAHPRFTFKTMDEVPAYLSPLMRTCDNDQYPSIKTGNERETYGFLYSVPFYATTGELRGVISAILRANTLEALLLDRPFVPVTEADVAEQKQAGWAMPEPSRFVLSNAKYDIHIQDRRVPELPQWLEKGVPERNTFKVSLAVHGDAPWELRYYLPESEIEASSQGQRHAFWLLLSVVLGALFAASLAMVLFARLRSQLGAPTATVLRIAHRIAEGDLSADVRGANADQNTLLAALGSTTVQLSNIAQVIKLEANSLGAYSNEISSEVADLAQRTQGQANFLATATDTVRKLGQTVQENADNTRSATDLALQASTVAQQGGEMVDQVVHTMHGINDASKRISDITTLIDNIAFQTNILALNAAVEAARAGDQGRGFAVVAGEVRNLAKRSADAAHEIKDLITTSVERVERGSTDVAKAGETMRKVVAAIQQVNASVEKISKVSAAQISGLSDVGEAVTQLDEVTHQNAALVEQLSTTTANLNQQSKALLNTVAVFKT
ncbi:MAG: methyl-accepting chemotaxis protein [Rhodoferax sp.]|nr:methyl-accepting chemotaxis protein [Rhodoferax sp.]